MKQNIEIIIAKTFSELNMLVVFLLEAITIAVEESKINQLILIK
jgi:hypothetical protein